MFGWLLGVWVIRDIYIPGLFGLWVFETWPLRSCLVVADMTRFMSLTCYDLPGNLMVVESMLNDDEDGNVISSHVQDLLECMNPNPANSLGLLRRRHCVATSSPIVQIPPHPENRDSSVFKVARQDAQKRADQTARSVLTLSIPSSLHQSKVHTPSTAPHLSALGCRGSLDF